MFWSRAAAPTAATLAKCHVGSLTGDVLGIVARLAKGRMPRLVFLGSIGPINSGFMLIPSVQRRPAVFELRRPWFGVRIVWDVRRLKFPVCTPCALDSKGVGTGFLAVH